MDTYPAIFVQIEFIVHFDNSRGGIGWLELKDDREIRADEFTDIPWEMKDWIKKAKVGDYQWFNYIMLFRTR